MAYQKHTDAKQETAKLATDELKRRLKDGDTQGVYIFSGDEEYMKRYYFSQLCACAGESVNVTVLRDTLDFGQLCDELVSVPMQEFSLFDEPSEKNVENKRVIKLDSPDFSKFSDREKNELCTLLEDVGKMSIVVIYFSNIDSVKGKSNSAIIKKLSENALVCEFHRAKLGDAALLRWIKRKLEKEKISANPDVIYYICESIGTDMCLLDFELQKLTAYLLHNGKNTACREDVDFVCIKNTEAITFDVTNAISAQSFEQGVLALSKLKASKTEPLYIFGAIVKLASDMALVSTLEAQGQTLTEIAKSTGLRDFVVKRHSDFLRKKGADFANKFNRLCLDADSKLKFGADGYLVLENLLFRVIHTI